jgi:hypothetical protein
MVTGAGTTVVVSAGIVEVSATGAKLLGVNAGSVTLGTVSPFAQATKVRAVRTAVAETRRRRFTVQV